MLYCHLAVNVRLKDIFVSSSILLAYKEFVCCQNTIRFRFLTTTETFKRDTDNTKIFRNFETCLYFFFFSCKNVVKVAVSSQHGDVPVSHRCSLLFTDKAGWLGGSGLWALRGLATHTLFRNNSSSGLPTMHSIDVLPLPYSMLG